MDDLGIPYLIHFDGKVHHAQHFIGWRENPDAAYIDHNAKILVSCRKRGIDYRIVREWPLAPEEFADRLKERKNGRVLCPVCTPIRKYNPSDNEMNDDQVEQPPLTATEGLEETGVSSGLAGNGYLNSRFLDIK
ncbi:MAG: hypothetical protein KAS32_29640 [Candidatus Peribacteraceae bacterium]|nr:hypothetical protein [Candidatus Peribacteraceae bacterium]